MRITLVKGKRKPKPSCWYEDRIRLNEQRLSKLVELGRERVLEELVTLTHPLQFKLYFRRFFEAYSTLDSDTEPLYVYAARQLYQTSVMGAWFEAFQRVFNRSPAPSEMFDIRERGSTPWVDWKAVDDKDDAELFRLDLVKEVNELTDKWEIDHG